MRIAAISDIHGNLGALTAVLADIRRRGCDVIVNLGDILSGPLQPVETAELLMSLDLPTIRGNHERQLLQVPREAMGDSDAYAASVLGAAHFEWISGLPATHSLSPEVFLCHGTPGDDLEYFLEKSEPSGLRAASVEEARQRANGCQATLILCGHSHVPRMLKLDEHRTVVNPGSVGLQAFNMEWPFPHEIEIGDPRARYALVDVADGKVEAELIAVDYDHDAAAALAERRGRPEWAHALRTGRALPRKEH